MTHEEALAKLATNSRLYRDGIIGADEWADNVHTIIHRTYPDGIDPPRGPADARQRSDLERRTSTATSTRSTGAGRSRATGSAPAA